MSVSPEILGKWFEPTGTVMDFYPDGTMISTREGVSVNWRYSYEPDRRTIGIGDPSNRNWKVYEINIVDTILTLNDPGLGIPVVYKRLGPVKPSERKAIANAEPVTTRTRLSVLLHECGEKVQQRILKRPKRADISILLDIAREITTAEALAKAREESGIFSQEDQVRIAASLEEAFAEKHFDVDDDNKLYLWAAYELLNVIGAVSDK